MIVRTCMYIEIAAKQTANQHIMHKHMHCTPKSKTEKLLPLQSLVQLSEEHIESCRLIFQLQTQLQHITHSLPLILDAQSFVVIQERIDHALQQERVVAKANESQHFVGTVLQSETCIELKVQVDLFQHFMLDTQYVSVQDQPRSH